MVALGARSGLVGVRCLASAALLPFLNPAAAEFSGAQPRKEEELLYCVGLSVEVSLYEAARHS